MKQYSSVIEHVLARLSRLLAIYLASQVLSPGMGVISSFAILNEHVIMVSAQFPICR